MDELSDFITDMKSRRSCRRFAQRSVPDELLHACLEIACSAPSGANKQPWTYVIVRDSKTKAEIRRAAEVEEYEFYNGRAPQRWLDDLAFLNLNHQKAFLEEAPILLVLFAQKRGAKGGQHYYVQESVGLSAGFLISALHQVGLATVTHTPSPMKFLSKILKRPDNEKPFLLLPIGYPHADYRAPTKSSKTLDEMCIEHEALEFAAASETVAAKTSNVSRVLNRHD